MNTISTAKRVAGLLVLSLAALSLSSCGDETTPQGATISAPGDLTVTYSNSGGGTDGTASPLAFQVLDASGNPVPGVTIRFFAGGAVFMLSDRTGGTALNGADATLFETTTDDQGLSPTDVYAQWVVPACSAAEDISVNGTVTASVGVATAIWTVNVTASQC
ncbi:MAG: hypothetical protein AB1451_07880 [Nitrospirota bacterium]